MLKILMLNTVYQAEQCFQNRVAAYKFAHLDWHIVSNRDIELRYKSIKACFEARSKITPFIS